MTFLLQAYRRQGASAERAFLRAVTILAVLTAVWPSGALGQAAGQRTFASADAAATALVSAARSADEQAMLEILGPHGRRLVTSGDPAQDAAERRNFVQHYDQMHRLVSEPDGTTTLYIGADNWPTPIPLIHSGAAWYFDTDAAAREILYRRIGRNELSAIRVCEQLVQAEKDYAAARNGRFARKIYSSPGERDGLYWVASNGEPASPIGPLVASAVAGTDQPRAHGASLQMPYRGYYYHILTAQGAHAPGGARAYLDGTTMSGFAFIAWPAQYRSSGVMTFLVGEDGLVYQKDLGRQTATIARRLRIFDPDTSWQRSDADDGSPPPGSTGQR